jgi:hypothetical protein
MSELEYQSWPELVDEHGLLVVPMGATQQHGPHLPLGTDTQIAEVLANELGTELAVWSWHRRFPMPQAANIRSSRARLRSVEE